jgi:hypothetical protein
MAGKSNQVLNITDAKEMLDVLHDRVVEFNDRVVIRSERSDQRCVMISQTELDGLERAVEILSQTDEGAAIRDEVLRIAVGAMSTSVYPSHG